ncbi:uncharacterized protein C8orf58 homolog isoform X10 [Sagmatias obliquidens]|uniref:uncharacterized protein C8orf58 homolog isoform X10 n=1 Tax=Sagmatias obliquidens TaxID=3371155 RepID=UPI000F440327|nr:uncharacterized protein C8orf58 homolog isoform X10 [Lagenorhynchus obliquidens]
MLGRRRVFAVEPLGGRDGAGEDLARGCVVPGVTSTYRRIPDAAPGWSADSCKGHGRLRAPGRQVPLLKLASQDSGVEMAVGDRSLATSPGLSQDSLNSEPMQNAEPLALGATEPPARLSRLLASRKLEQVLERSRQLPTSSASLSHYRSPKPPSDPEYEMPLFGAGGQEATKAESDLEAGLEEAEVGRVFATWNTCAWYWSRWRGCSSSACSCRLRGPLGILKRRSRPWRLHLHPLTPRAVRYTGGGSGSARQRRQEQAQLHPQRISPTGTRSRSCSTGSGGGALDLLKPLPLLMALTPGLHQGTSLKGLQAKPSRRPLCHH